MRHYVTSGCLHGPSPCFHRYLVVCESLVPFFFCCLDENHDHAVSIWSTCFATFQLDHFAWTKHMRAHVIVSGIRRPNGFNGATFRSSSDFVFFCFAPITWYKCTIELFGTMDFCPAHGNFYIIMRLQRHCEAR